MITSQETVESIRRVNMNNYKTLSINMYLQVAPITQKQSLLQQQRRISKNIIHRYSSSVSSWLLYRFVLLVQWWVAYSVISSSTIICTSPGCMMMVAVMAQQQQEGQSLSTTPALAPASSSSSSVLCIVPMIDSDADNSNSLNWNEYYHFAIKLYQQYVPTTQEEGQQQHDTTTNVTTIFNVTTSSNSTTTTTNKCAHGLDVSGKVQLRNLFLELACLCQQYDDTKNNNSNSTTPSSAISSSSCCSSAKDLSIALPGVYPPQYTYQVCQRTTDVMIATCSDLILSTTPFSSSVPTPGPSPFSIGDTSISSSPSTVLVAPTVQPITGPLTLPDRPTTPSTMIATTNTMKPTTTTATSRRGPTISPITPLLGPTVQPSLPGGTMSGAGSTTTIITSSPNKTNSQSTSLMVALLCTSCMLLVMVIMFIAILFRSRRQARMMTMMPKITNATTSSSSNEGDIEQQESMKRTSPINPERHQSKLGSWMNHSSIQNVVSKWYNRSTSPITTTSTSDHGDGSISSDTSHRNQQHNLDKDGIKINENVGMLQHHQQNGSDLPSLPPRIKNGTPPIIQPTNPFRISQLLTSFNLDEMISNSSTTPMDNAFSSCSISNSSRPPHFSTCSQLSEIDDEDDHVIFENDDDIESSTGTILLQGIGDIGHNDNNNDSIWREPPKLDEDMKQPSSNSTTMTTILPLSTSSSFSQHRSTSRVVVTHATPFRLSGVLIQGGSITTGSSGWSSHDDESSDTTTPTTTLDDWGGGDSSSSSSHHQQQEKQQIALEASTMSPGSTSLQDDEDDDDNPEDDGSNISPDRSSLYSVSRSSGLYSSYDSDDSPDEFMDPDEEQIVFEPSSTSISPTPISSTTQNPEESEHERAHRITSLQSFGGIFFL